MRFTNIPLNRILAVLATLFSIAVVNPARAIDAPDAVVALWFPALGEDLSNSPKDSIDHAIWLIQRGEFRQAEEILDRVKGGNTVNVSGLFARKYLDSVRDTTVDIVPQHVADSFLRSRPNFEIIKEISAVPKNLKSPVYFAGTLLDSTLFTCLNSVPYMTSAKMISEVRGSLTDEVTQELAESAKSCADDLRDNSEFIIPHLKRNFAPYFKGIVEAALVPLENVKERAHAYQELAHTAAVQKDICASGFFLMEYGDVLAAPVASTLMMGISRDLARTFKTAPTKGKQFAHKLMLTNFDEAESAYASAQHMLDQCRGGIYAHGISVRRAYIAYQKGKPDAGALYQAAALQAKAHGDSRVARIAQATSGLLSGSPEPVREAINESVAARDFGATMTILHISEIIADRLVREKDEPDRAIALTISTANSFRDAQLPGAAAELFHVTSDIFAGNGRVETQLYFLTEALKSVADLGACRSAVINRADCRSLSEDFVMRGTRLIATELFSSRTAALSEMILREPLQRNWATLKSNGDPDNKAERRAGETESDGRILEGQEHIVEQMKTMLSAQSNRIDLLMRATGIAVPTFQTASNCPQKVVAQEKIKSLTDDKVMQQDFLAFRAIARCDPRVAAELKQAVREVDPIGRLMAARTPKDGESLLELNMRQQVVVQSMQLAFLAAFQLGEHELLANWIKKDSTIPALFADYEMVDFQFQWYSALTASKQGDHSETRTILRSLLTHPYILKNQTERLKVRSAIVETEIQTTDPQKSFEAYLEWRQDVTSQRQRQTGVRRATPESAELARLERRVAMGDTIGAQDNAQIRALLQRIPIRDTAVAPALALDSIVNAIPSDSTLVVYFMSRRLAVAWVREPGKRLTLLRLTEDVDSLIEDINAFSLAVPISGHSWRDDGARLYAKLIAPLGSLGGKQIIIVPSLMMERLPFDALGPKGGKTLVEQKSIVVLPNLLSPQTIREVDQSKAKPLVVGVNGEGLTLAVDEAKAIAKLLGTEALTGRAARIEDISGRLADASIIHLSTHALLNIENPFASTIELSDPGKPIEGWWLFRQPINARLVTLSACETARGNVGRGEGFPSGLLTGPSFADTFHTMGVRYVVGTMWKVDDNFANPLMIRFYQELQTANEDPVIALTNAKRALIRDGKANAAYLAGFQVSVRSLSDLRVAR